MTARRLPTPALYAAVAVLLGLFAAQTTLAMRTKSPTADEFHHHIANGHSYLVTGNFKMNPASPPVPRMLAGLPLLFLKAKAPLDHESWKTGDSPEYARQFFFHANKDMAKLVFWARVPFVILSTLFGLSLFLVCRRLLGDIAGLTSLALYCFTPDILAHSGLATADMAVAFAFFLTLISFGFYLHSPSRGAIIRTGIATGLAFLCKFSAIILFPLLLVIALATGKRKEIALPKLAGFLAVCFLTIWAGYFFEVKPLLKDTPDPLKKEAMYEKVGGKTLLEFARNVPVPLSTFASAFVSMMFTRAHGVDAYLMGEWSRQGWWYYYFIAFCIKNTLPFVLLSILGFVFIRKAPLDRVWKTVLIVPPVLFFAATLNDKAQAGIRYFLPVYPMMMIAGSALLASMLERNRWMKALAIALLAWHAREAVLIHPHYLAYFNQAAGGPANGYRWLRDSNIDWGQDLKGLEDYIRDNGLSEVVLSSMNAMDPNYPTRRPRDEEYRTPADAVYAIGAHHLEQFKWTASSKPTTVIGYSVFIYDLRQGKKNG